MSPKTLVQVSLQDQWTVHVLETELADVELGQRLVLLGIG